MRNEECPKYDSNYWLCAATIDPEVRIKGQENAYKEVIKTAAGPYVSDDDVRYIVDCIKEAIAAER